MHNNAYAKVVVSMLQMTNHSKPATVIGHNKFGAEKIMQLVAEADFIAFQT